MCRCMYLSHLIIVSPRICNAAVEDPEKSIPRVSVHWEVQGNRWWRFWPKWLHSLQSGEVIPHLLLLPLLLLLLYSTYWELGPFFLPKPTTARCIIHQSLIVTLSVLSHCMLWAWLRPQMQSERSIDIWYIAVQKSDKAVCWAESLLKDWKFVYRLPCANLHKSRRLTLVNIMILKLKVNKNIHLPVFYSQYRVQNAHRHWRTVCCRGSSSLLVP